MEKPVDISNSKSVNAEATLSKQLAQNNPTIIKIKCNGNSQNLHSERIEKLTGTLCTNKIKSSCIKPPCKKQTKKQCKNPESNNNQQDVKAHSENKEHYKVPKLLPSYNQLNEVLNTLLRLRNTNLKDSPYSGCISKIINEVLKNSQDLSIIRLAKILHDHDDKLQRKRKSRGPENKFPIVENASTGRKVGIKDNMCNLKQRNLSGSTFVPLKKNAPMGSILKNIPQQSNKQSNTRRDPKCSKTNGTIFPLVSICSDTLKSKRNPKQSEKMASCGQPSELYSAIKSKNSLFYDHPSNWRYWTNEISNYYNWTAFCLMRRNRKDTKKLNEQLKNLGEIDIHWKQAEELHKALEMKRKDMNKLLQSDNSAEKCRRMKRKGERSRKRASTSVGDTDAVRNVGRKSAETKGSKNLVPPPSIPNSIFIFRKKDGSNRLSLSPTISSHCAPLSAQRMPQRMPHTAESSPFANSTLRSTSDDKIFTVIDKAFNENAFEHKCLSCKDFTCESLASQLPCISDKKPKFKRPSDQVWVTSALCDQDVQKALVLCFSLRRSYTTRKIAVIASPKLSLKLRQALFYGFDVVFFLEEDKNASCLKLEEFAKLYSWVALRSFEKCAYVSPSMLAVKNCDEIFAEETKGFLLLENSFDTSVILFKPSVETFESILTGLKNFTMNGAGIGTYLKIWAKNQCENTGFLNGKYNIKITPGESLLGYAEDISIVNLTEFPKGIDNASLEDVGMLGKLVATHWNKIHQNDVLPLIEGCSKTGLSTIKPLSIAPQYNKEPIAIVGMSCRYPGSNNLEEFWNLIFQGQSGICNPPEFRWLREQCSRQRQDARKTNAGFLKIPVDEFDAKFFGISPKEVVFMDPQHRLVHELVWEGLEDACVDPHTLRGTCGSVFLGSWLNDYKDILSHSGNLEFYRLYMGNSIGAAAARISFLLGMTGPSLATESGCSSAMTAVHLACRSLQLGETNFALACGVNMLLHPFDKDEMPMVISPDGQCKTFSEDANGFARAEGAGVLVLKRLSDAMKSGDHIWGLIRGSSVSQEGVSKSLGTPTVHCESLAMKKALCDARVSPEQVSYVEAHGTGTVVGDPMEVAAIAKAYGTPNRKEPLIIGSVKTNVGHTESCSGITGIMKVILSMQHQVIPAHQNFTRLNPSIDLNAVPAIIPLECMEWKKVYGRPRIAGVSSFGITGTDAHVIIEEPPQIPISKVLSVEANVMERPLHILKLSTKSEEAMSVLLEKYKEAIKTSDDSLADISFSTNTGRANFSIRTAMIASSKEKIYKIIEQKKYITGEANSGKLGKICFLFTGQGSQYPGMAKQLYQASPVFRMHFDFCEKILKETYKISISQVLWPSNISDSNGEIGRTIYSQTCIFCVEYSLLKLWESYGVKPDYVLGHSLGEFAAAVCAGLLSVEDAIKLVAERSRLIDELPGGSMLVIKADQQQVVKAITLFGKSLDYAAINSSQQTVVAGDCDTILEFSKFCTESGMKCVILDATHAFHSKHMDPMLEKYRNVAKTVQKQGGGKCGYISGMRGDLVSGADIDADYWVQHTREKVNFLNASKRAVELGCEIFIEVGPQPVLAALTMINNDDTNLLCLPSLKRNEKEWSTILTTLAKIYVKGVEIDWKGLEQFYSRKKVRLPHYPFMGKKFWPDMTQQTGNAIHPLVGSVISNASCTKLFQCGMNLTSREYIKDHAIGQTAIFPGAGYLEMCLAAGLAAVQGSTDSLGKPSRAMKVENLNITAPLALEESKTTQVQTVLEFNTVNDNKHDWNDASVKIFHRMETDATTSSWLSHAHATFSPLPTAEEQTPPFNLVKFQETITQQGNEETMVQVYEKLASLGLKFGPYFRSIEKLWTNNNAEDRNTILTKVKVPTKDAHYSQYIIHPVILDAMIQAIMTLKLTSDLKKKLHVPIKIGKFVWLSGVPTSSEADLYIQASEEGHAGGGNTSSKDTDTNNCSALLLDSSGKILAIMSRVEFIDTTVRAMEAVLEQQTCSMPGLWEEVWRPVMGSMQYPFNLDICKNVMPNSNKSNNIDTNLESFNNRPDLQEIFNQLEKLVYYNMLRALYECGWEPTIVKNDVFNENDLFQHLKIEKQYRKQFSYFLRVFEEERILVKQDKDVWKITHLPPSLQHIEKELAKSFYTIDLVEKFKSTYLLSKIGANLGNILKGTLSALSILFPEDTNKTSEPSVAEFYSEYGRLINMKPLVKNINCAWMQSYKQQASATGQQRSLLRILEVGAGTGTYTGPFLDILETNEFEFEYTYTDISSAFFPAAEKRFEKNLKNIKFKKLNIEEDPISQGFVPSYYDLVCACDVIHATKNLKNTLANVRSLLKPNGLFDLCEITRVNRFITYTFGLLDGFWHFEDFDIRPNHCTLTRNSWTEVVQANGFSVIGTYPCANDNNSYMEMRMKDDKIVHKDIIMDKIKTWLVFHQETNETSNFLVKKFSELACNRKVIRITQGDKFEMVTPQDISLRPYNEQHFIQLMELLNNGPDVIEGIVYCWSLGETCTTQQEHILRPYFYLAKSMCHLKQGSPPRLCCLAKETIPLEDSDLPNYNSSTLWGFNKSLRNESFGLSCKCIDVGTQAEENDMLQIFYELWSPEKETQVAFHERARYVPKFIPHKQVLHDLELSLLGVDRFQLILPETKSIADLKFGTLDPILMSPGEIEIQVKASALNFRDVFSVLKPSEEFKNINSVGFDFAGVVKQVHPQVTKWRVGDNVFGVNMNGGALPSHIKLHEDDVLSVPNDMTPSEACTLPAVVTTSYHCLIDVAQIKATDTVLIHTASGGVGLSAIEICKHVGAAIIATAGSKRKQNYLRSLGIQHIFHSRNTEYGDKILNVTKGRGVDVVLNSLTSEGFKEATLKACAQGARFVEMSKLSIWEPEQVRMLRPDVQYTVVDVSSLEVAECRRLMEKVHELCKKKVVNPIPYVRFDGVNVREALQYMQKAKHIGKIVCIMPEVKQNSGKNKVVTPMFNANSTYLITGGLGGIGFEVCKWMVGKGAKHILLAGRNPPNQSMQSKIAKVNSENSAHVQPVQLDVSSFQECKNLLEYKIPNIMGYPKLRGIMHAAGTLYDGLVVNQTWENLSSTLRTKVAGTLNLHELTKNNFNLEHFVLFSSIAALFGSPGQSNHSAGNNFEDTFAHYRHSLGLPATSVNWGQWGEVGIATEVELPGIKPFSTLQGLTGLEYALKSQRTQMGVVNIESFVLLSKLFPHVSSYVDERVWRSLSNSSTGQVHFNSDEFWQQYDSTNNVDNKLKLVKNELRCILRNILKLDETDAIEDNSDFQGMGVDSLMLVELKNALQTLLGERATVNASALRDCNTVQLLSETLIKLIEGDEEAGNDDDVPSMDSVQALIKQDCILPEVVGAKPNQLTTATNEISSVLLTGSTGTLGPYVLKELSLHSQITEIFCLIRPSKSSSGEERLKRILADRDLQSSVDLGKVRFVDGNVALPQMGMEPVIWEELCNKVDAIFHCAASVQHAEHYKKRSSDSDMRAVNVEGTKNVLKFACTGNKLKHVYCASSLLAVTTTAEDNDILSEDWPQPDDYNGVTTVAYPITKFVGDVLMKQAILERGIPGKVFRFPLIVGDSKTGRFIMEGNHLMLFILKNGVMPSNPFPVSMLPVDTCAWVSVQLFLNPSAPSDIYNVANMDPDADQEFIKIAQKLGYNVELVEFSEFVEKIQKSTTDDSPFAVFKEFYRNEEDLMAVYNTSPVLRQWILDGGTKKEFVVSKKIKKYLPEFYNGRCPTMNHIYRDMLFAKNQGWLEKYTV